MPFCIYFSTYRKPYLPYCSDLAVVEVTWTFVFSTSSLLILLKKLFYSTKSFRLQTVHPSGAEFADSVYFRIFNSAHRLLSLQSFISMSRVRLMRIKSMHIISYIIYRDYRKEPTMCSQLAKTDLDALPRVS